MEPLYPILSKQSLYIYYPYQSQLSEKHNLLLQLLYSKHSLIKANYFLKSSFIYHKIFVINKTFIVNRTFITNLIIGHNNIKNLSPHMNKKGLYIGINKHTNINLFTDLSIYINL